MSSHRGKSKQCIKKSNLNRFDKLSNSDEKQMSFKCCALEKQMASLKEALQTLTDLLAAASTSGPQVSRGQSSHVDTAHLASTQLPPHSTPFSMTPEQLMYQTARLVAGLSDLERNMMKWDDPTQIGWIKFKDLYLEYINNGGYKSLYDLCSRNVIITLRTILQINDLKCLNSNDIKLYLIVYK